MFPGLYPCRTGGYRKLFRITPFARLASRVMCVDCDQAVTTEENVLPSAGLSRAAPVSLRLMTAAARDLRSRWPPEVLAGGARRP